VTLHQGLSFAIIIGMLVLFVSDRLRYDLVALIALLAAVACGVVPASKAFTGFSNDLLPLIGSALVLSAAVGRSGLIEAALRRLSPLMGSADLQIGTLTALVAALSAVMKNVGALAIFMPVALQMARRSERPVSQYLMPLAFGSLIGGMMTLIGTSPNLIASSLRHELLGEPYRMFDFLPVGAGIALVGVAFLSFGWRLIPIRKGGGESRFRIEDYTSELRLTAASPMVGRTVGELEALGEGDVMVDGIIREHDHRYVPSGNWTLFADDVLLLEGDPNALQRLIEAAKLELVGVKASDVAPRRSAEVTATEAVVTAGSPMIGRTAGALRLRQRYGANLLAASRQGRPAGATLRRMRLRVGDVIVLQGGAEAMPDILASLGCLPLAGSPVQLGRPRRAVLPVAILLIAVLLTALEVAPPAIIFTAGAVSVAVFGILTLQEIYAAIEWPILILLGSLIPVGEAVHDTGGTDLIAGGLSHIAGALPAPVVLALVLIITMLVTPVLHHAAAVIVMGPVAVSLAKALGYHADPFLMTVAVGASCDFLSPIGHQCNTLVMGPGGYRFTDYWRLGLPLSIMVVVVGVPLIMAVWPLH
jgi:di/tricarboxylate transporter